MSDLSTRHPKLVPFLADVGYPLPTIATNRLWSTTITALQSAEYGENTGAWEQQRADIERMIGALVTPKQPTSSLGVGGKFSPTVEDYALAVNAPTPDGPKRMMTLKGAGLGGSDVTIALEFGPAVRACLESAAKAGHTLVINNAYRNYDPKQANAAQGGTSNHRRGLAVDFDMVQSSAGAIAWVHRYGVNFGLLNHLYKPGETQDPGNEYNHFSPLGN